MDSPVELIEWKGSALASAAAPNKLCRFQHAEGSGSQV